MSANLEKILVIGATGRIGSALRRYWDPDAAIWQARRVAPGFSTCDPLAEPQKLAALAKAADTILCLAGTVPRPGQDVDFELNTALATATLHAARAQRARVLLCSSAAVYGDQSGLLHESAALAPANAYGVSKARMEESAQDLAARLGLPLCVLRIGNVAGFDAILGGWRDGFQLDRFADGATPQRSYVGVKTLALTLQDLARAPALPACLNVAQTGCIAMGDLLDQAGLPWQARPAPDGAIPSVQLDVSALARLTPRIAPPASAPQLVHEWHAFSQPEVTP